MGTAVASGPNLVAIQGLNVPLQFPIQDQNGNPVDLTAATVTYTITRPDASQATGSATVLLPSTGGVVEVVVTNAIVPVGMGGPYYGRLTTLLESGVENATDPRFTLNVATP